MSGYSGTPIAKKLGIGPGCRVLVTGAPAAYRTIVDLPDGVTLARTPGARVDVFHAFVTQRSELASRLPRWLAAMRADAVVWVSWPKRASKLPTDVTEDVVREVALPLGLVDVKVCAVDERWSGLKLVIRKERRAAHAEGR